MPEATPQNQTQTPAPAAGAPVQTEAPKPGTETKTAAPPKPAETKTETPPIQDSMAQRFAQLAQRERALVAEQRRKASDLASREAALKAREEAIAAKASRADEYEKSQQAALADPGQYLRKLYGENWYDRLTQYRLEGEKTPPPDLAVEDIRKSTAAEIERIRKENEERFGKIEAERKAAMEAEKARLVEAQRSVIEKFKADTVDFVRANAEKYELTNGAEAYGLVYQVVQETFDATSERDEDGNVLKPGRILSIEEASDAVEKYLEEQLEKLTATKKWTARKAPAPASETASEATKTLTNALGGTASGPSDESKMDRYQRAAAAMAAAEEAAKARATQK